MNQSKIISKVKTIIWRGVIFFCVSVMNNHIQTWYKKYLWRYKQWNNGNSVVADSRWLNSLQSAVLNKRVYVRQVKAIVQILRPLNDFLRYFELHLLCLIITVVLCGVCSHVGIIHAGKGEMTITNGCVNQNRSVLTTIHSTPHFFMETLL